MANNPYVNKVEYGGQTIIDISGTTAVASDVAQGKIFFTASGAQATGTATGGGAGMKILVTAPTGATVTASKDGGTYSGVEDPQNPGSYIIEVPEYGTYTVTALLNGKVGNKTVTLVEDSVSIDTFLPPGYTPLDYLQSSGTQYLDTGISAPNGFRFVGKTRFIRAGSENPDGIAGAMDSGGARNWLGFYSNGSAFAVGAGGVYTGGSASVGNNCDLDMNNFGTQPQLTANGAAVTLNNTYAGSGRSALSLLLFAIKVGNNVQYKSAIRLYSGLRIYTDSSDSPAAELVAAKRDADGVLGMYDNIRDVFLTNIGTGAFIEPSEV